MTRQPPHLGPAAGPATAHLSQHAVEQAQMHPQTFGRAHHHTRAMPPSIPFPTQQSAAAASAAAAVMMQHNSSHALLGNSPPVSVINNSAAAVSAAAQVLESPSEPSHRSPHDHGLGSPQPIPGEWHQSYMKCRYSSDNIQGNMIANILFGLHRIASDGHVNGRVAMQLRVDAFRASSSRSIQIFRVERGNAAEEMLVCQADAVSSCYKCLNIPQQCGCEPMPGFPSALRRPGSWGGMLQWFANLQMEENQILEAMTQTAIEAGDRVLSFAGLSDIQPTTYLSEHGLVALQRCFPVGWEVLNIPRILAKTDPAMFDGDKRKSSVDFLLSNEDDPDLGFRPDGADPPTPPRRKRRFLVETASGRWQVQSADQTLAAASGKSLPLQRSGNDLTQIGQPQSDLQLPSGPQALGLAPETPAITQPSRREMAANEGDHPCPHCSALFGRKSNLNRHIRGVHLDIRPFGCATCGKRFQLKQHLQFHLQTVHEQAVNPSFVCEMCGAEFRLKSNMQRHIQFVHGDDHNLAKKAKIVKN